MGLSEHLVYHFRVFKHVFKNLEIPSFVENLLLRTKCSVLHLVLWSTSTYTKTKEQTSKMDLKGSAWCN